MLIVRVAILGLKECIFRESGMGAEREVGKGVEEGSGVAEMADELG